MKSPADAGVIRTAASYVVVLHTGRYQMPDMDGQYASQPIRPSLVFRFEPTNTPSTK